MSEYLRSLFLSLSPELVTESFLLLMLSLSVLALVARIFAKAPEFVAQAPGLMTSLGILGTFTGIIIGLFEFTLADIETSIEALLDGLKTAFITSVCGIGLSILLRMLTRLFRYPADAKGNVTSLDDIHNSLLLLQRTVAEGYQRQLAQNDAFTEDFAKASSKALISEMAVVVENFNQRIERQFGDNMARFGENCGQFDVMVGQLTEEYRAHEERVAYWSEHCDGAVVGLVQVAKDLQNIHTRLADLPQYLETMDSFGTQAREQVSLLNEQLETYRDTSASVKTLIPELAGRIDKFADGIDGVQQLVDSDLKASLKSIAQQSELLGGQITAVSGAFEKMSSLDANFIQSLVQETVETHREGMQELAVHQARTHQEMVDSLSLVIRRSIGESESSISKQYEMVERRMEQEVDAVMAAMGEALAAISGQFTRDYKELIGQLQNRLEHTEEVA